MISDFINPKVTKAFKAVGTAWLEKAACRGKPLHLFFIRADGGYKGNVPDKLRRELEAPGIRICNSCPVQRECLRYSIIAEEKDGTWGGVGEKDRKKLIKRKKANEAALHRNNGSSIAG